MTRNDFFNVAYALRRAHPLDAGNVDIGSDDFHSRLLQWEKVVLAMANHLGSQYVSFKRDLFLAAAGYSIKPDGSMWNVDWVNNRIPNFRSI
ncbi:MAG: hypothetical protein EHM33_05095 [Chloroflexi bacterium]|jgi:hypothetical protein|nr:MAG: hypothetical protein EHM33_05095 [Chloroflexota bacterium]